MTISMNSPLPSPGASFTCEITDLCFGGDGVGRLPEGCAVFVPFTAVGDRIEGVITHRGASFCRGEIRRILQPGPGRMEPVCPYYGQCGGCSYQHLEYSVELAAKRRQFLEAMRRLGHLEEFPEPEVFEPSLRRMGYRNKLRLEPFRRKDRSCGYGFCSRDNKTFFPVPECLLAMDEVNKEIAVAKKDPQAVHNGRLASPASMTLRLDAQGKRVHYFSYASPKMPWLRERLLDRMVAVPVGSFWQVNPSTAAKLLGHVRNWLSERPLHSLIDAYGGIGTFSLAMGDLFAYRVIIESDRQAVACSEYNHREAGLKATYIAKTTEQALEDVLARITPRETCVILDPPRTGCQPKALRALLEHPVDTLVYVSCNVATLARDLRLLSGTYKVEKTACFDMFPCTAHFESAVLLRHTETSGAL